MDSVANSGGRAFSFDPIRVEVVVVDLIVRGVFQENSVHGILFDVVARHSVVRTVEEVDSIARGRIYAGCRSSIRLDVVVVNRTERGAVQQNAVAGILFDVVLRDGVVHSRSGARNNTIDEVDSGSLIGFHVVT